MFLLTLLGACQALPPKAERGEIDLSSWDFGDHGSVSLRGEWQVFWNALLDPGALAQTPVDEPSEWTRLPAAWNGQVAGGRPFRGSGYATYRLRIRSGPFGRPMALWVQEQSTAYRLWFDGKLVASNGVVGTSSEASRAEIRPQMPAIDLRGDTAELVLQVSNFDSAVGGATRPIVIGEKQRLEVERQRWRDLDVVLFGSLAVLALYHAGLFFLRRRERWQPLFLALVCAAFACRIPFFGLGGRPLADYVPGVSWATYSKVTAVLTLCGVVSILLYVVSMLRSTSLRTATRWVGTTTVALCAVFLVVPRRLTEATDPLFFAMGGVACLYVLVLAVRATWRREPGGWTILLGWFVMATAGLFEMVSDVVGSTGTHPPIVPIGVFAFFLMQSWVVAHRLYRAFSEVERLSQELQAKNVNLRRLEIVKDEFLANTSHELRTPVHGIVGLTESLLRGASGELSSAARESLGLIVSSGRRLGSLINDLLDLTRLQRDDIVLRPGKIDPRALAGAVLGLLEPVARAKGLALTNTISPQTPLVRGDENRLHQVLVNLVGNAIKFTERGEVKLSAACYGNELEISVRDTGIGIAAENLDIVFERCRQLDVRPGGGNTGMGLGLAIARKLVELHGSTLTAESREGEGSRFAFRLALWNDALDAQPSPAAESGELPRAPHAEMDASLGTTGAEPKPLPPTRSALPGEVSLVGPGPIPASWSNTSVLVVDDDVVNLRVVASHLTMAGAAVRTARSGNEALQVLQDGGKNLDLILLDVMMPGLNGYEVTRQVRETHPPSEIPIILLTARGQTSDVVRGFQGGANDYLVKPFSADELLVRGHMHVQLKRAFSAMERQVALERALEQQREREERALLRAERERLEKLRYQLNPHFLFNALTSIRGALATDAPAAREMVSVLGDYCRLTLAHGQKDLIRLRDEFDLARLYVQMDEARRLQPVQAEICCEPALEDFLVPTFLIQPLVENAIKYGRRTSKAGGLRLRIAAERASPGGLVLRVSNSGEWVPDRGADRESTHVGLENVRRRLRHHFGEAATLSLDCASGWVHAAVHLPGPAPSGSARTPGVEALAPDFAPRL